ncbi:conserved hypothetical protein [Coccidioides posadasii str. Silveira]|uniref:Uncharacterized protein n=2 Tax=Coccidioides posadasii TaxID=199306 RepID=E9DCJ9_COCPS|nr:conserved hypothetical protein [Coccidioides posadasii str. Silveira]KMM69235.1 hypothetical protein CPAG_05556 [Coccidioides posadasii RMSCC 3488]
MKRAVSGLACTLYGLTATSMNTFTRVLLCALWEKRPSWSWSFRPAAGIRAWYQARTAYRINLSIPPLLAQAAFCPKGNGASRHYSLCHHPNRKGAKTLKSPFSAFVPSSLFDLLFPQSSCHWNGLWQTFYSRQFSLRLSLLSVYVSYHPSTHRFSHTTTTFFLHLLFIAFDSVDRPHSSCFNFFIDSCPRYRVVRSETFMQEPVLVVILNGSPLLPPFLSSVSLYPTRVA